ncbi:MAG: hypothetical protein EHM36_00360 [Deltaproteobacteria bacterium]|nr:MAG: hypothetical protein EHM36_00360 [Deltaproteobacteria bacterium]
MEVPQERDKGRGRPAKNQGPLPG